MLSHKRRKIHDKPVKVVRVPPLNPRPVITPAITNIKVRRSYSNSFAFEDRVSTVFDDSEALAANKLAKSSLSSPIDLPSKDLLDAIHLMAHDMAQESPEFFNSLQPNALLAIGIAAQHFIAGMIEPAIEDHFNIYETLSRDDAYEIALQKLFPAIKDEADGQKVEGAEPDDEIVEESVGVKKKRKRFSMESLPPLEPPAEVIAESLFARPTNKIITKEQAILYLERSMRGTVSWEAYIHCLAIMAPKSWLRLNKEAKLGWVTPLCKAYRRLLHLKSARNKSLKTISQAITALVKRRNREENVKEAKPTDTGETNPAAPPE